MRVTLNDQAETEFSGEDLSELCLMTDHSINQRL